LRPKQRRKPIVFQAGADPVEIGLVASLNRPGGNLTGVSVLNATIGAKRLQLLHELVPSATSIAFLANPANPVLADSETKEVQTAARALGVHLLILNVNDQREIEAAFATLVQQRTSALQVSADPLLISQSDQLVALAAQYAVPTMFQYRESTAAGGLMSYGSERSESSPRKPSCAFPGFEVRSALHGLGATFVPAHLSWSTWSAISFLAQAGSK
jgi:putative ABC transport system substrate-binding protein